MAGRPHQPVYTPPAITARHAVGALLYGSDPLLVPSAHFAQ